MSYCQKNTRKYYVYSALRKTVKVISFILLKCIYYYYLFIKMCQPLALLAQLNLVLIFMLPTLWTFSNHTCGTSVVHCIEVYSSTCRVYVFLNML